MYAEWDSVTEQPHT